MTASGTPEGHPHVPVVDLPAQYRRFQHAIDRALADVLQSGSYILGPQVQAFEREAAAYLGVAETVAVGSGTAALRLALTAAGIGPGDEVITTPYSFIATTEAILSVGATPVFADIDPDTLNLDPQRAAAAVTPATRALLPVHLFGLPADMNAHTELAERHDLALIEDAAQCFGGRWHGRRAGSFGVAGCFSFYPTKSLGCYGDGGLVATGSIELAERLRHLRDHGRDARGRYTAVGINSRLDELQAAILRAKLPHLDADHARRRRLARRYEKRLAGLPVTLPAVPATAEATYSPYTIRLDHRDAMRRILADAGIATAVYYGTPIHREPVARRYAPEALPHAEAAAARCLSLPLYPEMTDEQVDYVADRLRAALAEGPSGTAETHEKE